MATNTMQVEAVVPRWRIRVATLVLRIAWLLTFVSTPAASGLARRATAFVLDGVRLRS